MDAKTTPAEISPDLLGAIADAHAVGNGDIIRRVSAVSDALVAGFTVKDIAAGMAEAAARGVTVTVGRGKAARTVPVTAESQNTLGRAKATLTVLDKLGVTLATAVKVHPEAVADAYRAVSRHGVRTAVSRLSAHVDAGTEPGEKLRAMGTDAAEMVADAVAARKTSAGKPREAKPAAGSEQRGTVVAQAMMRAAADVAAGKWAPTVDELSEMYAAAHALIAELDRLGDSAPAPTPATARIKAAA